MLKLAQRSRGSRRLQISFKLPENVHKFRRRPFLLSDKSTELHQNRLPSMTPIPDCPISPSDFTEIENDPRDWFDNISPINVETRKRSRVRLCTTSHRLQQIYMFLSFPLTPKAQRERCSLDVIRFSARHKQSQPVSSQRRSPQHSWRLFDTTSH